MANEINIDITASDRASAVIGNLQRNVRSFSDGFKNSFLGNLGATAVVSAIDAVTGAFGKFSSALSTAASIETKALSTANAIAVNMGVDLTKASQLQKESADTIAKLASTLPGSTAEYTEVANQISGTLGRTFKNDLPQWKATLSTLTGNIGVLANAAGTSVSGAGADVNRLLTGGGSYSELKELDFFQKNPDLMRIFKEEATRVGLDVTKLKEWSAEQRIKIFGDATKVLVNPAFLARLNGTAEAQIESMRSSLFDPQVGVFGFLRKIPSLGDRSILDSFSGLLQTITKLSTSAQALASKLGISFDPLKPIGDLIDFINDVALGIDSYISNFKIDDLGYISGADVGKAMANIVNSFIRAMTNFILSIDWSKAGVFMVRLSQETFIGILSYFANFDYGAVLRMFFSIFQSALRYLQAGFVTTWDSFINSLKITFQNVLNAITNIIPEPLRNAGATLGNRGGGLWNEITKGRDFWTGREKPLETPLNAPKAIDPNKKAYAPNVTVYPSQGMDEVALGDRVMDRINSMYTRYTQESLA